jgi:hypothetical protein
MIDLHGKTSPFKNVASQKFETHGMMRRRRTYKKASTPRIVGSVKQFGQNAGEGSSIVETVTTPNRFATTRIGKTKTLKEQTQEMRTSIHLTNHGLHSGSFFDASEEPRPSDDLMTQLVGEPTRNATHKA